MILERTRAPLAAKRVHGAVLGNRTNLAAAQAKSTEANRAAAAFVAGVLPIVRQIQTAGTTTSRALAAALSARGIRTIRGELWHRSTIRNVLAGRRA